MRVLDGIRKRLFLQKMVFSNSRSSGRGSANTVTVIFISASNHGLVVHDASLIADGSVVGVPVPKAVIIVMGMFFVPFMVVFKYIAP